MLAKQSCQRFRRRHFPPSKYALLTAGEALAYQKYESLITGWIFAANRVRASTVETLEVVGVLVSTKWAQQCQHLYDLNGIRTDRKQTTAADGSPQPVSN